jgi:hypothetical protein
MEKDIPKNLYKLIKKKGFFGKTYEQRNLEHKNAMLNIFKSLSKEEKEGITLEIEEKE